MCQRNNVRSFPAGVRKKLEEVVGAHEQGNDIEALRKCISLIDKGFPEAYAFAAGFYEKGGNGIPKDFSKAKFYYKKSVEECGATEAYLGLARIYYYGLDGEKDYCGAMSLYLQLVEQSNNPQANLMLGRMYQDGLGVKRDYDKAASHYERAWEAGYVFGLTYLGLLEQRKGNYVKGALLRLKAGYYGMKIVLNDPHDSRVRKPG